MRRGRRGKKGRGCEEEVDERWTWEDVEEKEEKEKGGSLEEEGAVRYQVMEF